MICRAIVMGTVIASIVSVSAGTPGGQTAIAFKETLSITQDDWLPYQIIIDPRGNIYVLSGRERTLLGFDPAGREIFRRQFPKGQGPGEFDSLDPVFSQDGRLYAADWSQRRLTVLDTDFKVVQIEKMKLYGSQFQMDSRGQRYFLAYQASKAPERNRVVLTKCAPSGDILKEISGYDWGPRRVAGGLYEDDLYRTQIKYALDLEDNVVYAASDKYEISVISPSGDPVRTVTKDLKPRKVAREDLDRLLPDPAKKSPYKYLVPDRVPAIAGLFPLKDGHLLVVTFEKIDGESSLAGDLFDVNGRFLATVRVPKYYQWDFLMAPMKSKALAWNDGFYTIESDADEERFWVKRYQLEWK